MSFDHSRAEIDANAEVRVARPAGTGFPRSARLLDTSRFDWVFAAPRRSSDNYFTVLGRTAPADAASPDAARLGLAIAKRCAPHAVARNRIKRVIRESFRQARGALKPIDLVVLCRRAAVDADNATLYGSLARHWKRFQR